MTDIPGTTPGLIATLASNMKAVANTATTGATETGKAFPWLTDIRALYSEQVAEKVAENTLAGVKELHASLWGMIDSATAMIPNTFLAASNLKRMNELLALAEAMNTGDTQSGE